MIEFKQPEATPGFGPEARRPQNAAAPRMVAPVAEHMKQLPRPPKAGKIMADFWGPGRAQKV